MCLGPLGPSIQQQDIPMSNRFSKITLPAAIAATVALSVGAALAQSQQTGNPPSTTQAKPGQPSGAGTDQTTQGDKTMPMQGMEHGRMMQDQNHKMMQKEHGQMGNAPSGNPSTTQAQPGQPSGAGTDQTTQGRNAMPMQGQMGKAPCGQGQTQTQNSGCK